MNRYDSYNVMMSIDSGKYIPSEGGKWVLYEDHVAMVAAAYEDAAKIYDRTFDSFARLIRDHTPTDARTALDAMLAKARDEGEQAGLRKAAAVVSSCTWGDYWRKDGENLAPIDLSDAILALINQT